MSEGTAREIVMKAALRDQLGQAVRAEWVRYCLETGDTKPSHISPWDELSDWDKEADRRIADAVLTEAGALAPAALTGDERSERYIVLEKATLLRWRDIADRTATTLSAEIDRELWIAEPREDVAPAADAATGAPS